MRKKERRWRRREREGEGSAPGTNEKRGRDDG